MAKVRQPPPGRTGTATALNAEMSKLQRPLQGQPEGAKKLSPGVYPGLAENKRFALKLKGLEIRRRSGAKVRSRFSPHLVALQG